MMNNKRLPVFDDFARMQYVSEPAYSSAADTIAYTVCGWNEKASSYVSRVVLGNGDTISANGKKEEMPKFSPDGKQLYFLSDVSGISQLHCCSLEGKNVKQLTGLRHGGSFSSISPDGIKAALVTWRGGMEALEDMDVLSEKTETEEPWITEHRGYRKNGVHEFRKREIKLLYVLDTLSGECRYLYGDDNDLTEIAWMPDSENILVLGSR